jgi:hypothetical protein
MVYFPAAVPVGTAIDSVEVADPPGVILGKAVIDVVKPVGATVADNETVSVNEFSDFTVIVVEVSGAPGLIVRADGEAEIEKSGGGGTFTNNAVAEWHSGLLIPVIVTEYVPAGVP